MLSIIVAISDNYAIGRAGDMPWHISADLKYFKRVTAGHAIIMGRRTWESIGCRPLKNRQNIVVSRTLGCGEGFEVASSLKQALNIASGEEVFVIGGGKLYAETLPLADRLYVTHVHTTIEDADTFFPQIDPQEWTLTSKGILQKDEASGFEFEFAVYDRKEA